MNIATAVIEESPKVARFRGLILLLSAGWLLVAGVGCESHQVVPCGPPSADFTPTVWHCWDGGPLAYRDCNVPCGAAPTGPVPTGSVPTGSAPTGPAPDGASKPFAVPPQPVSDKPVPENPVPENPIPEKPVSEMPLPEAIPIAPSPPSVLPTGSPDSSQYRPCHYDGSVASDQKMHSAIDRARASVGNFTTALKSPKSNQSEFQICAGFTDGQKLEYLWIRDIQFDGKFFSGRIGEEPQDVKIVQRAQRVTIAPARIADWMYSENGMLVGGYTLRAIRESLSPAERVALDNSVPFAIDPQQPASTERLATFDSPDPVKKK